MSASSDHILPYQRGQYPPECHAITLTTGGQYALVEGSVCSGIWGSLCSGVSSPQQETIATLALA